MSSSTEPFLQGEHHKRRRFIDREGVDERSNGTPAEEAFFLGKISITKMGIKKLGNVRDDWFHSFASLSTSTVIITILIAVGVFPVVHSVVPGVCVHLGVLLLHIPFLWIRGHPLLSECADH